MNDYINNLNTISERLNLNDNLSGDPLCYCDENCGEEWGEYRNECKASTLKSNLGTCLGTWEWHDMSNAPIYIDSNIFKEEEGESMDEMIERIVHDVVNQLAKKGDLMIAPKIEKYHIKHK